jgi:hypothetical protein
MDAKLKERERNTCMWTVHVHTYTHLVVHIHTYTHLSYDLHHAQLTYAHTQAHLAYADTPMQISRMSI